MHLEDFKTQTKEEIEATYNVDLGSESTSSKGDRKPKKLKVVVTQPRRVAAIQMAKRVSQEKGCKFGGLVGYTIRFEDMTDPESTQIKYVTDGILVRECLMDANLSEYSVVILDEAHERSLNTDILFALVKQAVLRRRGSLRLIVTSATLKTEIISAYYFNCPTISVSGRCYKVDIMFTSSPKEERVESSVNTAIRIHLHEPSGDILVFLTGFEECEKATKLCFSKLEELATKKNVPVPPMMIIPLYGSQTSEQQSHAFVQTPENCRKIIFSTNIAETSLTVSNIGYVIDCGYVKQKIYNANTGMEQLLVVPISKVQAIQRTGRAGRTREGKCIRLYSEKFFNEQMPNSTVPEIKRVNLSSTVLTLKNIGIDDVINFDYLDPPDSEQIIVALKQLYQLQAIDKNGKLQALGKELGQFPLEPTYAKALLASDYYGSREDMMKLVSILSSENIWTMVSKSNEDAQKRFQQAKQSFIDKYSDHMSLVYIYDDWQAARDRDRWCFNNFIQQRALRQASNIRDQLRDYMKKVNWDHIKKEMNIKREKSDGKGGSYERCERLRKALSEGFFMNTSRKIPHQQIGTYLTVNDGALVKAERGSNFAVKEYFPDWVIFTELSGTASSQGLMKMSCEIQLSWVEDKLPLLKEVDVQRLSGKQKQAEEESRGSKRNAENNLDDLESQLANEEQQKLDKQKELRERFLKRQKKK